MADPTFVELTDILADGSIPAVKTQNLDVTAGMKFSTAAGQIKDRSHMLVYADDGAVGAGAPVVATTLVVRLLDSTDIPVGTGQTTILTGPTVATFDPVTEDATARFRMHFVNSANQNADVLVEMEEDGIPVANEAITVDRNGTYSMDITVEMSAALGLGDTIDVYATRTSGQGSVTVTGTAVTSLYEIVKQGQA